MSNDSKIQELLSKSNDSIPVSPAFQTATGDLPVMLEVRLDGDERHALAYHYLYRVLLLSKTEMSLLFTKEALNIKGHNLIPLFDVLKTHKVAWIQERKEAISENTNATFITEITLKSYEDYED